MPAPAAPLNQDLPSSWLSPGVFASIDTTGAGAGINSVVKRLLLVAHKLAAGVQPNDTPIQITTQTDVFNYFGRGSDCARMFQAVESTVGGGAIDIWICGIVEPAAGVQATHLITFVGTTAAVQASVTATICGYKATAQISANDTPTIIASNLATQINLLPDIPVTAAAAAGTITLTARHKGLTGNDCPVIIDFTNTATVGITASPGTLTYATNAVGAGSATVTIGGTTITAAINNSDTPTIIATNVAAAINAANSPVTATAAAGVVTLLYAGERVVHRISAAIVTSTGTTVTPAVGTQGSGAPVLTTALSNIAGQSAYLDWATAFNDVASLGTLSNHIETYANGLFAKNQTLYAASTDVVATAGAIPVGTSPLLSASPRYHIGWCVDSPQQAYELAARHAARVCFEDYHPANYDGEPFKNINAAIPLLLQHKNSRPDPGTVNVSMRTYYLTPYTVDESLGRMVIHRGRTTSNSNDQRLWDTSTIKTLDFYRYDLAVFLRTRFKQMNIRQSGIPHTPRTITTDNVRDAIIERVRKWDDNDLFDGVDDLKSQVKVSPNATVPSRFDTYVPCRPPTNLHQIGVVAGLV